MNSGFFVTIHMLLYIRYAIFDEIKNMIDDTSCCSSKTLKRGMDN